MCLLLPATQSLHSYLLKNPFGLYFYDILHTSVILKHIYPLSINGTLLCSLHRIWGYLCKVILKVMLNCFSSCDLFFVSVTHLHISLSISLPKYVRILNKLLHFNSTLNLKISSSLASLKLLERIQLDKSSLLVKSSNFSLMNSWWNSECTWWPSILIFDWLQLFYLIHCVSQNSLLDICLNAIHFLSKSLFLIACDSLIITFAFPSSLEQAEMLEDIIPHCIVISFQTYVTLSYTLIIELTCPVSCDFIFAHSMAKLKCCKHIYTENYFWKYLCSQNSDIFHKRLVTVFS